MKMLQSFWEQLDGKKSYIISFCSLIAAVAYLRGFISKEELEVVFVILTGGGIAALRVAIEKKK